MLAQFNIIPVGSGESIGDSIAEVIRVVEKSGLPYRANAMGTVIEGEWEEVMGVIQDCHDTVLKNAPRVMSSISVDIRPSKPNDRISEKIRSVENRLGKEVAR